MQAGHCLQPAKQATLLQLTSKCTVLWVRFCQAVLTWQYLRGRAQNGLSALQHSVHCAAQRVRRLQLAALHVAFCGQARVHTPAWTHG